jgi:uncharacterized protein YjbI with pentapeptide repeats
MALPTNNSRPAIPYQPDQVLPNYNRYENLGQFPPTAQQLDGDLNRIIDLLNTQASEINGIVVGALPGAREPNNANHLITTDGNGNISWTLVSPVNLGLSSVGTVNIIDAAVTSAKIQPQAIQPQHIENNAVWGAKIYDGAVTTAKISNNAITSPKIANSSIIDSHILLNNININKLRSSGHACFLIGNNNDYTYSELPALAYNIPTGIPGNAAPTMQPLSVIWNAQTNNSLSGNKIELKGLVGNQLADATITANQIADGNVTTAKIANLSITGAKLANNTVTNVQIADGTITTALYANLSITGAKLANNTVTNAQILDGTITTALYANASITGAKLANNTVTNAQIADGTITTALYANASITGAKLANNTLTNAQILDGTITGALIANSTIPKTKLQNSGQIAPFAILSVASNATILKSLNIASVTKVDLGSNKRIFRAVFTTAATSGNAIVIATPNDVASSPYAVAATNYTQSTTQVDVAVRNADGSYVYGGFDMIVYDI